MKKQLLLLSLAAAALLVGCSKNESDTPVVDNTPVTEISAKAVGSGSIDTKAPVTGTSLNGHTAEIYSASEDLDSPADRTKMFTDAYARGTMTFDDVKYVGYDPGFKGKSLLPADGTELYMYGFYPTGWGRTAGATYESLTFAFDGHHDVMATWLTAADNLTVKYNAAPAPDKADFTFKHLLTRYNIQVKANAADAEATWGHVKSVTIKEATVVNRVTFAKKDGATLGVNYDNDGTNQTPASFFRLSGTLAAPTYADTKFAAADYATGFTLTTTYQNACYSMVAPTMVDATSAAEVTLIVKTVTAAAKEITTEVPVTLDQTKFTSNGNSTRGYSITLALNFRVGVIQAVAIVEAWKDGGDQTESVLPPYGTKIGEAKDGGIVYWIDPADATNCKVFSLDEASSKAWSAKNTYVIGDFDLSGLDETDGKINMAAIKDYYASNPGSIITESTFDDAFPAAAFCDAKNTGGVTGWYLPAKNELVEFYTAYKANKIKLDKAITDNGGTSVDGKFFWSGTEFSNTAWSVTFSLGNTSLNDKGFNGNVRCIKIGTPPPPPPPSAAAIGDAKDGGTVCWVNPSDPTDYKVVSHDQKNLAFSHHLDEIGVTAQSRTDGRTNTEGIKNFAKTKGFPLSEYDSVHFCDEKGDGWYMPAIEELIELYTQLTAINAGLQTNGGTLLSRSYFSNTEDNTVTDSILYLEMTGGSTISWPKGDTPVGDTRCIRRSK